MAELTTIARPYAQAIFSLAKEKDALPAWSDRLERLAVVITDDQMRRLIGNPAISAAQTADLLLSLCEGKPCAELAALITLLADNERLSLLPFVQDIYNELMNADQGIRNVELTSAFALNDEQLQKLTVGLEKLFSCRLKPEVRIDASLLGGFTARVGSKVYDASVRGRLQSMSDALKKN